MKRATVNFATEIVSEYQADRMSRGLGSNLRFTLDSGNHFPRTNDDCDVISTAQYEMFSLFQMTRNKQ